MPVLVVEDQLMFRDVLSHLLSDRLNIKEVIAVENCEEARSAFEADKFDFVIVDVDLPDGDGLELADEFAMADPRLRILAVSGQNDEYTLSRVLQSGVIGFVDKTKEDINSLEHAIREIMEWRTYFAAIVHQMKLAQKMDPRSFSKLLTDREVELLRLFGVGLRNEEIAEKMELSDQTVQGHRRNIMKKLELSSTPELIRYALRKGFTRVSDILMQSDED